MKSINNLPTYDFSSQLGSAFNQLPLINYASGSSAVASNFVITAVSPANPM